jgi:hypothetical protein
MSASADDEESLLLVAIIQEGFLAPLGMTALVAFFRNL